jgi:hypothetical protein
MQLCAFYLLFMPFGLFSLQRTKTPELVPEDSEPIWFTGAQKILSANTMKQRIRSIIRGIYDRVGDPRNGPFLLLGALLSFGTIWLRRSQPTHSSRSNQPSEPGEVSGGLRLTVIEALSITCITAIIFIDHVNNLHDYAQYTRES